MVVTDKGAGCRGVSVPLRMWALKPCVVVLERLSGHSGYPGHPGLRRRVYFDKTERCSICCKSVVSRWLALHMEMNHGEVTARDCAGAHQDRQDPVERRFVCELCGKAFTRKRVVSYNLRGTAYAAHTRSCSSCSAGSMRRKALQRTGKDEGSTTLLASPTSPASRTTPAFRTSPASKAVAEQKAFLCKRCGRQFRFRGMLKAHERKHSVEAPRRIYRCEVCGSTFTWGSLYRAHLRIHQGRQMQLRCGHCGERFQDLAHLRSHVGRHGPGSAGEPFGCALCHLNFRFFAELRRHACRTQHAGAPRATLCSSAVSRNPQETLQEANEQPLGVKPLQSPEPPSPEPPSPEPPSPVARVEQQGEPPPEVDNRSQSALQMDENPNATCDSFDEQLLDPLLVSPEAEPLSGPEQPLACQRPRIRVRRSLEGRYPRMEPPPPLQGTHDRFALLCQLVASRMRALPVALANRLELDMLRLLAEAERSSEANI